MDCHNCGNNFSVDNISRTQREDGDGEMLFSVSGSCESCGVNNLKSYAGSAITDHLFLLEEHEIETILDYDHFRTRYYTGEQLR